MKRFILKFKQIIFLIPVVAILLCGCSKELNVLPSKLSVASNEVKLIVNSVRDLNDIVTLRFEPKNVTNRDVIWSCETNEVFTLDGSTIKANKVGNAIVKATSVENEDLYANINIKVYDPNSITHKVSVTNQEGFEILGLKDTYDEDDIVEFEINIIDTTKKLDKVYVDGVEILATSDFKYSFDMPNKDVTIEVKLIEDKSAKKVTINPNTLDLTVGDSNIKLIANVTPIDTTDSALWSVIEGSDVIQLTSNNNEATISALKTGTAKVKVTYNSNTSAECTIKVTEKVSLTIENLPNAIDLDLNNSLKLSPNLNQGEGTFAYKIKDESIASVDASGLVSGLAYGTTTIEVSSIEHPDLIKSVNVEVCNHGSIESPLSVEETLAIANKVCANENDYTSQVIYTKGIASNNSTSTGKFTLLDENISSINMLVYNSTNNEGVAKVGQHDEVVLKGYIMNYKGTIEFNKKDNSSVEVISNKRGNSTISLNSKNVIVRNKGVEVNSSILVPNGETFEFEVEGINGFNVDKVKVNDSVITPVEEKYSFEVFGDMIISIETVDSSITFTSLAKYNVKYDLGTRKTAKQITTSEDLIKVFELDGTGINLISSIDQFEYIYGGGNGGRSETAWYTGDMLKFGTTSYNGSVTLKLSEKVNRIVITGYVSDNAAKIQVGDSLSTDWTTEANDNKTTTMVLSSMNEVSKDIIDGKQTTTVIIDFESTDSLKISTLNKKPIYITSIEFISIASSL